MKKKIILSVLSVVFLLILSVLHYGCSQQKKFDQILYPDKKFDFPKGFPPDPGEEGRKTLEGIDSDKDGVRDDVQRFIYALYLNHPLKRKALIQNAKLIQRQATALFKETELKEFSDEESRSIACNTHRLGDTLEEKTQNIDSKILTARILNTTARSKLYLKNDRLFSGGIWAGYRGKREDACDP